MSKGTLKRSTTLHGVGAGATLLAIVAGSLFGMQHLGIPFGPVEAKAKVEEAKEEAIPVASYTNTPAYVTLKDALSNPPGGWTKNGEIITSPQSPYPFSCVTDGASPAVSFAQGYGVGNKSIQVVTSAYTAGLGTAGIANEFAKAQACVSGDATMSTQIMSGLGAESYLTTVNKGGLVTNIVTWRNGDVITYLIADKGNGNAFGQAQEFNNVLTEKLNPVCINQDSGVDDQARTIWSSVEFAGLKVNAPVSINKVPLPEVVNKPTLPILRRDLAPAGFEFKGENDIKPVPLPAEEIKTAFVERPEQPNYPVWPPLPKEVELPTAPEAPTTEPPTTKDVLVKAKDEQGPGCGWAFTATIAPKFDAKAAEAEKVTLQKQALDSLKSEAVSWQASVLNYWKAYATYKTKAETWNEYAARVAEVKAAWDVIAQKWATYNANLANYEASVEAREQFVTNQTAAKKQYDADLKACKTYEADLKEYEKDYAAYEKEYAAEAKRLAEKAEEERLETQAEQPTPSPTPSPSTSPTPKPSPSPTPSESTKPTPAPTPDIDAPERPTVPSGGCPVPRPAILDETAPDVLPKPTPPADPRPADQRD